MKILHFLKILIALALFTGTTYAWAAPQTCPDTSKPLAAGWVVYEGQITGQDKFQQAIIIHVLRSTNCIYSNPTGRLILSYFGTFKPRDQTYWSTCPTTASADCCMDSESTCSFIQTAP